MSGHFLNRVTVVLAFSATIAAARTAQATISERSFARVIEVRAPRSSRRVTAHLSFGAVKDLRFDASREIWRGRFFVSEHIPDGEYSVLVTTEDSSGNFSVQQLGYYLNRSAGEFGLHVEDRDAVPGGTLVIQVDSVEAATEVSVDSPSLGWSSRAIEPEDRRRIDWVSQLTIPLETLPGEYRVRVTVFDESGAVLRRWFALTVLASQFPYGGGV